MPRKTKAVGPTLAEVKRARSEAASVADCISVRLAQGLTIGAQVKQLSKLVVVFDEQ